MSKKVISMRQRILLSQYMKGFAVGADLVKSMRRVVDQDGQLEAAWRRGYTAGRKAAEAAEDLEERTLLGEIGPEQPERANI